MVVYVDITMRMCITFSYTLSRRVSENPKDSYYYYIQTGWINMPFHVETYGTAPMWPHLWKTECIIHIWSLGVSISVCICESGLSVVTAIWFCKMHQTYNTRLAQMFGSFVCCVFAKSALIQTPSSRVCAGSLCQKDHQTLNAYAFYCI